MKLWEEVANSELSYQEIMEKYKGWYFTRPEWDGFHFIDGDGNHVVITKDRELLIVKEEEVLNKDSNDWMIVSIIGEAISMVANHQNSLLTPKERKTRNGRKRK